MPIILAEPNPPTEFTLDELTQVVEVNTQPFDSPTGIYMRSDGVKLYQAGVGHDRVYRYHLSTPWDLATAVVDQNRSVSTSNNPDEVHFKSDGTVFYTIANRRVFDWSMSTPWDVTTATYTGTSMNWYGGQYDPEGIFIKPDDGTKLYAAQDSATLSVLEYDLSPAWDLSSPDPETPTYVLDVSSHTTGGVKGVELSPDGKKMILVRTNTQLSEYTLSTAWDLSTATYIQSKTVPATVRGITMKPDGTRLYTSKQTGSNIDRMVEWSLA